MHTNFCMREHMEMFAALWTRTIPDTQLSIVNDRRSSGVQSTFPNRQHIVAEVQQSSGNSSSMLESQRADGKALEL